MLISIVLCQLKDKIQLVQAWVRLDVKVKISNIESTSQVDNFLTRSPERGNASSEYLRGRCLQHTALLVYHHEYVCAALDS